MNSNVEVVAGGSTALSSGEAGSAPQPAQPGPPKVLIRQTERAKKNGKRLPIFTEGELIPLKGVWFQLVRVNSEGLLFKPKVDIVS